MIVSGKSGFGTFVVIQPEDLERMKKGDPCTIDDLIICYEEGTKEEIAARIQQGGVAYLLRGYERTEDDEKPMELVAVVRKPKEA